MSIPLFAPKELNKDIDINIPKELQGEVYRILACFEEFVRSKEQLKVMLENYINKEQKRNRQLDTADIISDLLWADPYDEWIAKVDKFISKFAGGLTHDDIDDYPYVSAFEARDEPRDVTWRLTH